MASRLEFSTKEPDRALPVLESFFPKVRMSNPRGNFSLELSSLDAELFSLLHNRLQSPSSSSSTDATGTLMLGMVESGAISLGTARGAIDTSMPWLFPQERVRADWDDVTLTALTVSIPDALRVARAQLGDDRFRLQFVGTAPLSPAHGEQWALLVRYLRKNMDYDNPVLASDLVLASTHAHIISMLLATFPNNAMSALIDRHESAALPGAVRRAIQYMESNAHLPITVEDIARESRLSIRGLQYAFRSSLDSSPTTYLRRIRLAGAHSALQAASPDDGSTVAGIALEWGFPHPSRFAKQYRAAYGVSPRRTLES